ncbi:MAG: Fur family transcriptional regulator [Bacillota bacterium]
MTTRRYKRSRQREYLYKLLQSTDKHPTASWLYDQLKPDFANLSMGTVYRNINILIDQNLIQKIEAGSSFDRYDANTEQHYHFFCQKCEAVSDIPLEIFENLNKEVSETTGYQVENHRLDFYGICLECIYKEKNLRSGSKSRLKRKAHLPCIKANY